MVIHTISSKFRFGYVQCQTYYLCIFATLSELLHSVGMLYVVHGDCIYHHHAVIFSETARKSINRIKIT